LYAGSPPLEFQRPVSPVHSPSFFRRSPEGDGPPSPAWTMNWRPAQQNAPLPNDPPCEPAFGTRSSVLLTGICASTFFRARSGSGVRRGIFSPWWAQPVFCTAGFELYSASLSSRYSLPLGRRPFPFVARFAASPLRVSGWSHPLAGFLHCFASRDVPPLFCRAHRPRISLFSPSVFFPSRGGVLYPGVFFPRSGDMNSFFPP